MILVFIAMAFILIRQIFELQIIQGENYISEFENRITKTRVLKSTRGNIYDRNGEMVASNILSYSLTFEDNGSYETTREKNLNPERSSIPGSSDPVRKRRQSFR